MDLGLRGRRCIITGGSKGIGAAAARALAQEGADVDLLARNKSQLGEQAAAIEADCGVRAVPIEVDLSTAAGVERGIGGAIVALGGVDVLVNNAGASPNGSIEAIDDATWQESLDLKLMGYVRAIRAVLPPMRAQQSGAIINVLGIAGIVVGESYVLACINTALAHVTRSTALHAASDGIRVLGLHPGPTATERLRGMMTAPAEAQGVSVDKFLEDFGKSAIPVGRVGVPAEPARLIALLASDVCSFMTGSCIEVDGGLSRSL